MTFATIKSLLFLTESDLPADGEVAVEDLVKFFPSKHKAAIQKLWGSERLTFHGEKFFSSDKHGPVYDGVLKAAEEGFGADTALVNINIAPSHMPPPGNQRKWRDYVEDMKDFEADIKLDFDDAQEVYLGYQPSSGNLWVGFDAWLDESDLNEKIDDYMDSLDNIHGNMRDDVENYIGKEAQDTNFFGVLMELTTSDGKTFEVSEIIVEPHGFYKGVHSHAGKYGPFSRLNLIDLRTD
jgi:hypothetical protein